MSGTRRENNVAGQQVGTVIGQLHRLVGRPGESAPSDALLLEDFIVRRDEKAFEVLVWRHASMVLGVCGRVLRDSHAAEDAFQAAFLVFARKADTIGRRESVGGWLYKVAHRVALRARYRARRDARVEPLGDPPGRETTDAIVWNDLRPVLDEEIGRLPEKYRVPFVLCYLEGLTNEEAAGQIGCPKGTVLSRLARGREWLRTRLARRGVSLPAASLLTILSANAVPASVPTALVGYTVRAAIPFAAGKAAGGLVPASVATLTDGVLYAMLATKLRLPAAVIAVVVLSAGAGLFGRQAVPGGLPNAAVPTTSPANTPAVAAATAADPPPAATAGDRGNEKQPDIQGYVVAVSPDGKTITVDAVRERGGKAVRTEVTIGEKTALMYDQVAANKAKPTEGYAASVWTGGAAKGPAARIDFWGPEAANRGLGLPGIVTGIDEDGKGFELKWYSEPVKVRRYRFNDKTVLHFYSAAPGKAEIAEKMEAIVFTDEAASEGENRVAGYVELFGGTQGRLDREPDVTGKLLAADDKTLTMEVPPAARGGEPKKVVFNLGAKCSIGYRNVGPGGAKPVAGQVAKVWLAEGSKDTASDVTFTGVVADRWVTIVGKVVGVSGDGATVTLEQASAVPDEKPRRVEIKLAGETKIVYSKVGPGEAKPTVGYAAELRLLDGSKDTASIAYFTKSSDDQGR
jgi:RNA polymerase sigma factor (sigma-70 family)